ncbi:uncharacterized protein [Antedon mediterranea]|uniref:uncharacterized protein n=1 Tax=Antedon mediterranea TaxID=105859 RepID=UPI003AF7DB40
MGGNNQSRSQSTVSLQPVTENQCLSYDFCEKIGEGQFGIVYKGKHQQTNKTVAIKQLQRPNQDQDPHMLAEIESLKIATHKNVVQYMESFQIGNTIYIVMEYCDFGHITSFIKSKKPNLKVRMGFIQDIASGIAHLHGLKISHRDVKPANILVDIRCVAKLADFGLAKILSKTSNGKKLEEMYMRSMAGTYAYAAPEVTKRHYNAQADIFSMGIVFCCILDDELKGSIEKEMVGLKMHMFPEYTYTVPVKFEKFMHRLITQMLQRDYHLRPKAQEIST